MEIRKIKDSQTWALRKAVMWPDKPLDYVRLKEDDQGLHYGLYEENELVSVVSLFIQGEAAQFRKFATSTDRQGKGHGSRLLTFVMAEAQKYGVCSIWCNARVDKAAFYEKFGLEKTGKHFTKGGKDYVIMAKQVR
jgi:predicted GNAT family N-acyltransferase